MLRYMFMTVLTSMTAYDSKKQKQFSIVYLALPKTKQMQKNDSWTFSSRIGCLNYLNPVNCSASNWLGVNIEATGTTCRVGVGRVDVWCRIGYHTLQNNRDDNMSDA